MNRKISSFLLAAFLLLGASSAFAQTGLTSSDPCALLPHKTVAIPAAATPTAKLIAGVLNQNIYICGCTLEVSGATPQFILSHAQVAAATPSATSTRRRRGWRLKGSRPRIGSP